MFFVVLRFYIWLVVSLFMGRRRLVSRRLVFSLRLEPWVVQGLSEIEGVRGKIELYCEGLVSLNRKGLLDSQNNLDSRVDVSDNFFSEKIVKKSNVKDVLHSSEDSLE
jgi:hypothetical protein